MCGLNGAAGQIETTEEKVIKDHLVFSQVRGYDSTGIASVGRNGGNNNRSVTIAKELGPPCFLFDTKQFDKCFYGFNSVFIGHNRSSTVGKITRKNAHPFLLDDIVGAHNGTLDWSNKDRLHQGRDTDTDSEAIFKNIQEHGIADTISKIDATEAYALTWYDRTDHSVNLIRNDKRPLLYCMANDGKTMFWGSEFELMMAAVYRHKIKVVDKVWLLSENVHYKFVVPLSNKDAFDDPVTTKLKNREVTGHGYGPFTGATRGGVWNNQGKKNLPEKKPDGFNNAAANAEDLPEDDMIWAGHFVGMVPNPNKVVVVTRLGEGQQVIETVKSRMKDNPEWKDKIAEATKFISEQSRSQPSGAVTRFMSPEDVLKKKSLEHVMKANILPNKPSDKLPLVYSGEDIRVYRDRDDGLWWIHKWDTERKEWGTYKHTVPPICLPLDILKQNDHSWNHVGRKRNKKIYYKGFKSHNLNQEGFNELMKNGCFNCGRMDMEWGHKAIFFSEEHDFICEHCVKTPGLLTNLLTLVKESKTA